MEYLLPNIYIVSWPLSGFPTTWEGILAVNEAAVSSNTKKTSNFALQCLQIQFYHFWTKAKVNDETLQKTIDLRYESRSGSALKIQIPPRVGFDGFHQSSVFAKLALSAARSKLAYNHWGLNLLFEGRTVVVVFTAESLLRAVIDFNSEIFKPGCLQDGHKGGSQTIWGVDGSQTCFYRHFRKRILQLVFSQ